MQNKLQKNIPEGWERGPLGKFILDIRDGGTPSRSSKDFFGGDIPWITVKDISPLISKTLNTLSEEGLKKSSAKLWPAGTVILSFGATIGEVGVASVSVTTKQGIAGMIPSEKLTNKFLYYFLTTQKEKLNKLSAGSTIKEVRPAVIQKHIIINIPTTREQNKIVEILSGVDDKIEKVDEVIKKTEKLKKGLMQELFTKGIGHTKFKKTKLGMVPEEWEVIKIKKSSIEIEDGDRGVNYPKNNEFYEKEFCLFLNNKNIKNDKFIFNECNFITEEKDKLLRKGKLKRYDVVLTTRGTVGNVAYYDDSVPFDNIRINSGMVALRTGNDFDSKFLYFLFKSPYMKSRYSDVGSGSAQPQLPIGSFNQIEIVRPGLNEQKEIAEILSNMDEKISINKQIKEKLAELKKGLMQDLLSGEMRV